MAVVISRDTMCGLGAGEVYIKIRPLGAPRVFSMGDNRHNEEFSPDSVVAVTMWGGWWWEEGMVGGGGGWCGVSGEGGGGRGGHTYM